MSKPTAPADGGAMPAKGRYNRRKFLRGLAAVPVIGGATAIASSPGFGALAAAAPTEPHESVVRLLDIERRLIDLTAQVESAYCELDRTVRIARRAYGVAPQMRIKRFPGAESEWAAARHRLRRAEERFAARRQRIDQESGYAASSLALEALKTQRDLVGGEVWFVKAVDIAGLKVKARMAMLKGGCCASTILDILDLNIAPALPTLVADDRDGRADNV